VLWRIETRFVGSVVDMGQSGGIATLFNRGQPACSAADASVCASAAEVRCSTPVALPKTTSMPPQLLIPVPIGGAAGREDEQQTE
jgi:hypothetical protein